MSKFGGNVYTTLVVAYDGDTSRSAGSSYSGRGWCEFPTRSIQEGARRWLVRSIGMKIGVEVEYWVVDETGRLCTGRDLLGAHEHVVPEFVESSVEIQTSPLDDESAIRRELQQTLRTVLAAAEARGKHLVPLGTPLTAEPMSVTSKRGEILERIYGNRLDHAKHCAGTHLHFDKGTVTHQLNLLTALDPALSLLSSSPYYDGERVASSARASVYRCKSDPEMAPYRDLWRYTTSVEEWNQRSRPDTVPSERWRPNEESLSKRSMRGLLPNIRSRPRFDCGGAVQPSSGEPPTRRFQARSFS